MRLTRKTIYLIFALILLVFGVFFVSIYWNNNGLQWITDSIRRYRFSRCFDEYGKKMDCDKCVALGGKGNCQTPCELPAKDSGKECVYNDECDKKLCVYSGYDSSGEDQTPGKPKTISLFGFGGATGVCSNTVVKPDLGCTRKRGEEKKCSYTSGGCFAADHPIVN